MEESFEQCNEIPGSIEKEIISTLEPILNVDSPAGQ
jgi:hypothetical protein